MVGAARLELTTPRSQSEYATNCATPRHIFISKRNEKEIYQYLLKILVDAFIINKCLKISIIN